MISKIDFRRTLTSHSSSVLRTVVSQNMKSGLNNNKEDWWKSQAQRKRIESDSCACWGSLFFVMLSFSRECCGSNRNERSSDNSLLMSESQNKSVATIDMAASVTRAVRCQVFTDTFVIIGASETSPETATHGLYSLSVNQTIWIQSQNLYAHFSCGCAA